MKGVCHDWKEHKNPYVKTHDLTQPEFARIVGISRNSLSRYENGTSSVSTELIDIIVRSLMYLMSIL